MIRRSDLSQRQVERKAGFSKGYLSQLLAQNLDLKVWHLLAILDVFAIPPAVFFERVFPTEETPLSLRRLARESEPVDGDTQSELEDLYQVDLEVLARLRRQLERHERDAGEIEEHAFLDGNGGSELDGAET